MKNAAIEPVSNNTGDKISIAPWLSVGNGEKAVTFYKAAFGAVETYRLENPEAGLVVKLSVNGAEFWLSGSNESDDNAAADLKEEPAVRMILTVADPEAAFTQAMEAGARQIFPVTEEHGWKLGRIVDPFGFHWEIGCLLKAQ